MRTGLVVNPFLMQYGPYFECFVMAGVPIWVLWGFDRHWTVARLIDPFVYRFSPPRGFTTADEGPVCSILRGSGAGLLEVC